MCGRYSLQLSEVEVREGLERHNMSVKKVIGASNARQSANIAPQSYGAVYRDSETLEYMRWGLQPSFVKEHVSFSSFNTRAESLRNLKPFWSCAKRRRGVVVMDGYYEWQHSDGTKLPWFIKRKDNEPLLVLAIWDRNEHLSPEYLDTFSIVTTEAASAIKHIHPRMPVAIDYELAEKWIKGDWPDALKVIKSLNSLECYKVGTAVNKIGNQSPSLNKPLKMEKKLTDFFTSPKKSKRDECGLDPTGKPKSNLEPQDELIPRMSDIKDEGSIVTSRGKNASSIREVNDEKLKGEHGSESDSTESPIKRVKLEE